MFELEASPDAGSRNGKTALTYSAHRGTESTETP